MKKIPKTGLIFVALFVSGVIYAFWSESNKTIKISVNKKNQTQADSEAFKYLRNLARKYSNLNEYFVEIDYELKDEINPSIVVDRFTGMMCFNQHNQFFKSYDSETIINDEYNVLISDEDRTIFIARRDSMLPLSNSVLSPQLLDSIQRFAIGIPVLQKLNDSLFTISYQPRFEQWKKVLISFNPTNNTLKEMQMWIDESITDENSNTIQHPVLLARYSNERFSLNQKDLNKFKTNQLLEVQSGRLVGKGKFATYMIEILPEE